MVFKKGFILMVVDSQAQKNCMDIIHSLYLQKIIAGLFDR